MTKREIDKLCWEADEKGQEKVLHAIKEIFKGYFINITIDTHFDDYGAIDIYMTGTTKNNNAITYAMECKDRKVAHTYYPDYILEKDKKRKLLDASKKGYKPIYINTFTDDYMIVWDLNRIDFKDCSNVEKTFHKYTVVHQHGDTYQENKISLKTEQARWIGKMR